MPSSSSSFSVHHPPQLQVARLHFQFVFGPPSRVSGTRASFWLVGGRGRVICLRRRPNWTRSTAPDGTGARVDVIAEGQRDGNMSEKLPIEGHDSTLQSSSMHNGIPFNIIAAQESPRSQTMLSREARRDRASKRRRPAAINTKTALLSIIATAPVALAQNCISLSGSRQCPAFSAASISTTDPTILGF